MKPIRQKLTERKSVRAFAAAIMFLIMILKIAGVSQAQTAQWIQQAGTGGISNGVSHDAALNCYATGMVSNPALFDNITIPCFVSDVFLAKYSPAGAVLWAKVNGGELLDQGNEVATDAAGNSYVAGYIQTNSLHPTASFDNITLTGHGDYDWFIAKYDASGNVVWAKNYGSTAGDMANGIALDPSGNIYVVGFFSSTMVVDNITVTSSGLFDVFIAKYTPAGTLTWLKRAGGTGSDIAYGVVADGAGNFGIVGEFQNTATFGSHTVTASGLGDAFIAKYSATGNNLWVKKGGGNISFTTDHGQAIAVDGANNFYITGDFTGTGIFDNLAVTSNDANYADIYLAKYNTNGAIQWLHHGGGVHVDRGYAVDVDVDGNSFVSGFADSGPGVVFDNLSLPPLGNEYIFLAKYNPAGAVQYVKQYAAGTGQDVHVLNNGCLYFSGGASKGNGNEFDDIDLLFNDRGAFIGKFCDGTASACASPTGLFANNITSTTAKINWSAVPGAIGYIAQYRKLGVANWKTKSTTATFLKLKNLLPSTQYEYHVATICNGDTSAFSPTQTFTTSPMKEGELFEPEVSLNAYPNPNQGTFTMELDGMEGTVVVDIFDINGKVIFHDTSNSEDRATSSSISLPSSFKGIAFIRVSDGEHFITRNIVVE
jgi:hypothetical protein